MQGHTRTLDPSYPGNSLEFSAITPHPCLDNFTIIHDRLIGQERNTLVADVVFAWHFPKHPRGLPIRGVNMVAHWRTCFDKIKPERRRAPLLFEVGEPSLTYEQPVRVITASGIVLMSFVLGQHALACLLQHVSYKGLVHIRFVDEGFMTSSCYVPRRTITLPTRRERQLARLASHG